MNIKEIAELAGVSRATISRYLNNGYVSEEKRKKIKAVIERTGYTPSSQAQTLRTKKTKLIGVIIPKISSETISRIVDGISCTLSEYGYQVLLANTDNNIKKEMEYLKIFKNNQVDGVVFLATILTRNHYKVLQDMPIPVVVVGQKCDICSSIYHDDRNAARAIVKKMIDSGAKNLAYLGVTEKDIAVGYERKQGFISALAEGMIHRDDVIMEECEFTIESGYGVMNRILSSGAKLDGVFCSTDNIAIGAISALKEHKIAVPEDVAVVGIGNTKLAGLITPKLTTVKYYYRDSGVEAAKMILGLVEEEVPYINLKNMMLSYEIILRDTIKKKPKGN